MTDRARLEALLNQDRANPKSDSQGQKTPFFKGLFRGSAITEREKEEFCTQLAVMLEARVALPMALKILIRQSSSDRMKSLLEGLLSDINRGETFAGALGKRPEVFDSLFVVTAEVGQESGQLPEVLLELSSYLEKVNALRRKFAQALIYPALVLTVAVAAVSFMLLFIVPAFGEMFRSMQVELPRSTRLVLSLSETLRRIGPYVLAGIVGVLYLTREVWKSAKARNWMMRTIRRIPLLGRVVTKNLVARFCRTLGTLLHAQVSLLEALQITMRIFDEEDIREEIGGIISRVKQGKAVSEKLADSKLFPPMVAQMITVGEETSELDAMLLRVAAYYEKEIDQAVDVLASVIEPVLVIVLGLLVAGILVAMYLPMFDLVNIYSGA